jgi:peroxiredoxin Q/BCP
MAPHPLIGQAAPVISLPDSSGATFTFTPGSSGQPAAILFYPKSGSYGCTQQVCQFRDALAGLTLPHVYAMICAEIPGPLEKDVFKDANIEVIGISPDSVEEQNAFRTKHNLSVSLTHIVLVPALPHIPLPVPNPE